MFETGPVRGSNT